MSHLRELQRMVFKEQRAAGGTGRGRSVGSSRKGGGGGVSQGGFRAPQDGDLSPPMASPVPAGLPRMAPRGRQCRSGPGDRLERLAEVGCPCGTTPPVSGGPYRSYRVRAACRQPPQREGKGVPAHTGSWGGWWVPQVGRSPPMCHHRTRLGTAGGEARTWGQLWEVTQFPRADAGGGPGRPRLLAGRPVVAAVAVGLAGGWWQRLPVSAGSGWHCAAQRGGQSLFLHLPRASAREKISMATPPVPPSPFHGGQGALPLPPPNPTQPGWPHGGDGPPVPWEMGFGERRALLEGSPLPWKPAGPSLGGLQVSDHQRWEVGPGLHRI